MSIIKNFLQLNRLAKVFKRELIIYIALAYIFNILIRYILYLQIPDGGSFFYNGEIIPIWTPDASLYGFYAKELFNGIDYPLTSEYIPAYLVYYISKYTGFSLESVIFFAPAFLSSLAVIPLILIADVYNLRKLGFLSALFGVSFVSYYYRTHLGYYDTDILNIFFPMFAIYFFIKYIHSKEIKYLLFGIVSLSLFYFWYHSSKIVILSIIITFIIYIAFFKRDLIDKKYLILGVILIIISLFFLDISIDRALDYLNKNSDIVISTQNGEIVKFKGALSDVAEAQPIDFHTFIERVSGNWVYFIISIFGYITLIFKYRSFFLTLPLIFIAFLSLKAGLRFTIYAVPIFSFTLIYGVDLIFNYILVKWGEFKDKIAKIATAIFTLFIVLFTIKNIIMYNLNLKPYYFSNREDIKALKELDRVSNPNDFIIAPWDYGWPLWYYANISTIVDNGNGHAEDKYIVSKILLSDNSYFVKNASLFFINRYKKNSNSPILRNFLQEYPVEYFKNLEDRNFTLPKIQKNSFILLHKGMLLRTFFSIESSSNFDLKSRQKYKSNLYNRLFLKEIYSRGETILETTARFKIDLNRGLILSTNSTENARVKEIVILNGNRLKFRKSYNTKNNIYILIQNRFVLIMNRKLFNSFLLQALFLNNYNRELFKEISSSRNLKILKVIP